MVGVTGAIIGAGVLGAGASIYAGSKAAKAQKKAAEQSADVEKYIYEQTRQDLLPSRIVGESALYKLADLYGVQRPTELQSPGGMKSTTSPYALSSAFGGGFSALPSMPKTNQGMKLTEGGGDFFTSPGYQFRLDEGMRALEGSQAARGRLLSGSTVRGALRVGQGLASEEFGNYTNALRSLAGVGQVANQNQQVAGQQFASGVSSALTQAGNARASSYANIGSSINSGINNALSAYLYNKSPILNPPIQNTGNAYTNSSVLIPNNYNWLG